MTAFNSSIATFPKHQPLEPIRKLVAKKSGPGYYLVQSKNKTNKYDKYET